MFLWAPFPILCWVNAGITDWVGLVGFRHKIHLVIVRKVFWSKIPGFTTTNKAGNVPISWKKKTKMLTHLCDTKVETQSQTAVTGISLPAKV